MRIGIIGIELCLAIGAIACAGDADHPAAVPSPPAALPTPGPAPSADATTAAPPVASTIAEAAAAPPSPSGPPGKLNVLLITIDSLRSDMPWNGYGTNIAPVMTAFEKTAVSYPRAYSISSYTAMSLPGLLAGRYPGELERSGYFFSSYPDSVVMFPELLQKAGVRTMSAHAHFYFEKSGMKQGFDSYLMVPGISADNTTDKNITSPQHLELAKKMLSDKAVTADKTFFAWFHFMDPHDEYLPHPGIGPYGKSGRHKYDAEVTFTDQHVGKLLEFVEQQPWGKNTAVIISADHGEAFGERKMYRHGFEIYEVLVRVPLLVRAPGATPRRIEVARSAIDLAPTILELTGTPAEPSFRGKSLVPELYGAAAEERDIILDLPRTSDNDRRRALIHGRHKLLAYGDDFAFELYDVVADPLEEKDLKRVDKALFEEMKALYKTTVKGLKDICPKNTEKLKGKEKRRRC